MAKAKAKIKTKIKLKTKRSAAKRLKVNPEDCLALDDLKIGTEAARSAGAATLLVAPDAAPDYSCAIRSLEDVHIVLNGDRIRVHLN